MTPLPLPHAASADLPEPTARRGRPQAPASRQPWIQTRRRVRLAVEDLRRTVIERCQTHPDRARLVEALDEAIADLETLISRFDEPLMALLDAANAASDREAHEDVLRRLDAHVADGRVRFAQDDLVELMDTNGFVELGLRTGLDAALAAIARQLRVPQPSGASEGG